MSNQDYRHLISQASYSIPPEDVPLLKDQKLAITVSKSEQQIADINQLTPADGASNFLVPKERRSAFVTGLNRLVPSWNSNELEVNVQHEQETGDSQQKKHCWEKIKNCCGIVLPSLLILLLGALVLGGIMAYLAYYPHPSSTFKGLVFGNDTIPLNIHGLSSALPSSYNTFWYDVLQLGLLKPIYPVIVKFVEGEHACDPLRSNKKVKSYSSSEVLIDPLLFPVDFVTNQFLTTGSMLTANITMRVDSIPENSQRIGPTEKLMVCILDDYNLYQDFQTADQRDLTKCLDITQYTFPVSNGTVYSFTRTFKQSSYYYMILIATLELTVQYTYKLENYFYNVNDYQTNYSCEISSETDWQDCRITLEGLPGCFFVSVEQGDFYSPNSRTMLSGNIHHKEYTNISTIVLAVGVILKLVLLIIVVVITYLVFRYKKCCFSHRKTHN